MFDNFHCLFNDQEGIKCNAFIYDRSQYFHYFVLKNSSRNQSLYCLYMCLMGTLGHRYLSPFFNLKINIWHPKFKWYGIQLWMEAHSFNTWSIKKKWYKIWHEYTLYKFYKKVKKKMKNHLGIWTIDLQIKTAFYKRIYDLHQNSSMLIIHKLLIF